MISSAIPKAPTLQARLQGSCAKPRPIGGSRPLDPGYPEGQLPAADDRIELTSYARCSASSCLLRCPCPKVSFLQFLREYTVIMNNTTTIPSGKNIFSANGLFSTPAGKTLGRLATRRGKRSCRQVEPALHALYRYGRSHHCDRQRGEDRSDGTSRAEQKMYRRYTGFPGGLREESFVKLLARRPESDCRSRRSRACCPRPRWAARWRPSSRSTRVATSTRTIAQQPSRWKSNVA